MRMKIQGSLRAIGWAFSLYLFAGTALAALQIEISQGGEGAIPVAVVPFAGNAPQMLNEVIAGDLARSGQFSPMPDSKMPERPTRPDYVGFPAWRAVGTDYLVIGDVQPAGAGQWRVEFHLFDVYKGAQMTGLSINARTEDLRMAGHRIADIVYEAILGIKGAFNTRIAYVTETKGADGKARYNLEVADSDGYNPQVVLESIHPIMSPSWSPDGGRIAYVSFEGRRSGIYIQDLASGRRERVASFPGINGAPAWSPRGDRLALTLSKDGNPEIYVLDLATRQERRLTQSGAIDTESAWSADSSSVIFTSDRSGQPQIYQVDASGGPARRLTFEGSYNAGGNLSPDGRWLATVHGGGGGFRIGVQDLASGGFRAISQGRNDERPSFAPNSAMILHAAQEGGRSVLKVVSVDGRSSQRLSLQKGKVRDPAWGPYRQ